jgi:hypothetical protein
MNWGGEGDEEGRGLGLVICQEKLKNLPPKKGGSRYYKGVIDNVYLTL